MENLIEALGAWGVPVAVIAVVVVIFIIMQVSGEIIEWTGKVAPKILKIRKIFKERKILKTKREAQLQKLDDVITLMVQVEDTLQKVNSHYDADNIARRDTWIAQINENVRWTHDRAQVYDNSVRDLVQLKISVDKLSEFTCKQIKEEYRNRILDFSHKLRNARNKSEPERCSEEEFRKIYETYNDYEDFLEYTGDENHQVDDAMELIRRAERGELPNIVIEN